MSLLIENGYVVTMNPARDVLAKGFVAVDDAGRIEAVTAERPRKSYGRVIDASGMIVLPGLINLHQHHWGSLLHGRGLGLALEDWQRNLIRAGAGALSLADLRISATLSAMQMVRTGTTCVLNHAIAPTSDDAVAAILDAMAEVGLRQVFAKEFPSVPPAGGAEIVVSAAIAGFERLAGRWHGAHDGLARLALAVEVTAEWTGQHAFDEDLVERAYALARAVDVPISTHLASGTLTPEAGYARARSVTGRSDVLHLMELGVLDQRWILAHAAHVDATDLALMAEARCNAVYAPTSEAIRGAAIGPWSQLVRSGVNCGLGTDGGMLDCSVDMVEQMKACVFIQNAHRLDAAAMSTETALEMATINAARALGLDAEIGSVEVGKRADVAVFDLRGPHNQVIQKPISNFICTGRGADAHTVLVGGRVVLDNGALTQAPDARTMSAQAAEAGRRLAQQIGLPARRPTAWPTINAAS
jgi:5-methylthioadenosine/S-adenosylhomocysteine deaminase